MNRFQSNFKCFKTAETKRLKISKKNSTLPPKFYSKPLLEFNFNPLNELFYVEYGRVWSTLHTCEYFNTLCSIISVVHSHFSKANEYRCTAVNVVMWKTMKKEFSCAKTCKKMKNYLLLQNCEKPIWITVKTSQLQNFQNKLKISLKLTQCSSSKKCLSGEMHIQKNWLHS